MTGLIISAVYGITVVIAIALFAGTAILFVLATGTAIRERLAARSLGSIEVEPQPQTEASRVIDLPKLDTGERKAA